MVARLKLKGIDGGSHKRWRMWLNSSYAKNLILVLTCLGIPVKAGSAFSGSPCTGAAWLSSARVVRCRVSPLTSETLMSSCQRVMAGTLDRLPVLNRRKVGMTSSPHGLYGQGCTRPTMRHTKGSNLARASKSQKVSPSSDCRLKPLHEAGIASNRGSAYRGEYVPEPCTHRPSSHESGVRPKSPS